MRKQSKGFTLVELLVVVAIIALLVSILLPSLGKAKEQARIVVCMSNLKGLGLGVTMYATQNDDWYPAGASAGADEYTWDTILQPYYESYGLLACPSDKAERPWVFYWGNDQYGPPDYPRYARSYAINRAVSWMGPSSVPGYENYTAELSKTSEVPNPGETIFLGEMWYSTYWGSTPMPGQYGAYQGAAVFIGSGTGRFATIDVHRNEDMANHYFCDGHVSSINADDEKIQYKSPYYYWTLSTTVK